MDQISVGGAAYEKQFYTIRVAENYTDSPKKNRGGSSQTEFPLGFERISIHIRDVVSLLWEGRSQRLPTLSGRGSFLPPNHLRQSFRPMTPVATGSRGISSRKLHLADGAPILIVPQSLEKPDVLPRPFDLMLATFDICHHTNTAPGLCETRKRSGTLTFENSDNH